MKKQKTAESTQSKYVLPIFAALCALFGSGAIIGITVLPKLITDPDARVVGLVIIVFLANAINFLFSGWSPWHMPYITPEVRTAYFSATSLVSNLSSTLVLIVASMVTDQLSPDVQLDVIVALRFVALAIAGLDIYFLQKPKEPEYLVSTQKHSLLNVFKLPLSDKHAGVRPV